METCLSCAERLRADARFCTSCGCPVDPADDGWEGGPLDLTELAPAGDDAGCGPARAEGRESGAGNGFCQRCGTLYPDTPNFCRECGLTLILDQPDF